MNNRTEAKLTDLSGMQKAIEGILKQAWERGRKYGQNEARPQQGEWIDHWSEDLQKQGYRQCSKCKAGCQIYEHGTRKSDLLWIDGQQYTLQRICNFCPNCGANMKGGAEK